MNRHRAYWSAMGSSQFEYNSNELNERQAKRDEVYEQFKQRILTDYITAVKEYAGKQDIIKIDSFITEGLRILIKEFR
jgi:hypothetical protein